MKERWKIEREAKKERKETNKLDLATKAKYFSLPPSAKHYGGWHISWGVAYPQGRG